jgi:hypothetical protein
VIQFCHIEPVLSQEDFQFKGANPIPQLLHSAEKKGPKKRFKYQAIRRKTKITWTQGKGLQTYLWDVFARNIGRNGKIL